MRKVYISGKITGLPKEEYMRKFNAAEKYLKSKGYEVINPAKTNGTLPESTTYEQYMTMSLILLGFCDTIYMLDNWLFSDGSKHEFEVAHKSNYYLMFEESERWNYGKEKV